jgi:hypothetical protein
MNDNPPTNQRRSLRDRLLDVSGKSVSAAIHSDRPRADENGREAESGMSSPGLLTCWPGDEAMAGVIGDEPGQEHLMMLLDPLVFALVTPPGEEGPQKMGQFLRELAHSATLMADRIDPVE